jgi:hypothetical protein
LRKPSFEGSSPPSPFSTGTGKVPGTHDVRRSLPGTFETSTILANPLTLSGLLLGKVFMTLVRFCPTNNNAPSSMGQTHGECLSRVSMRSLLMNDWKPCFWVFDEPTLLLVFREKPHYLEYRSNPFLDEETRGYLVKKRISLAHNFACHPITNKAEGIFSSPSQVYHFTVEEAMDYGPSTVIKFGSSQLSVLEDLRMLISQKITDMRSQRGSRRSSS